jgi:hypothetical protein
MSNNLLTPQIIARKALERLEANKVMSGLVYTDYSREFNKVGDTINIRKPATFVAENFTTDVVVQNVVESGVPIVLDQHLDVTVEVTSTELTLDIEDFSAQIIDGAVLAITERVDYELCKAGIGFYSYSGTSGTAPSALSDVTAAMLLMNQQKAPMSNRYIVFDPIAQAKMLELDVLVEVDKSGSSEGLRNASMGRVMGFDTYMDQNVYIHVAGGYTVLADVKAAGTVGASTMVLTSTAGTATTKVLKGDLFSVVKSGVTYQFVATADTASAVAGVVTVSVYPALPVTFSANDVTFADVTAGGHTVNIAANKNALALVSRQLSAPLGGAASYYIASLPNGLSIRVTMGYDMTHKINTVSFDMLIGTKCINPALGTVILG